MSTRVEENLAHMLARGMRAAARAAAFALKAEQEGHEDLALLFKAAADSKSVHSRRFLNLLRGKINRSFENLKEAFESESFGLADLYPRMVREVANSPLAVKKGFIQSMKTDEELVGLYQEAMEDQGSKGSRIFYVCQICGHIHKNSIPGRCPVCKAVPGKFKRVQ